jgi:hypothetical protein
MNDLENLLMKAWQDDQDFPVADWQAEVATGETSLGYVDWVDAQRDRDGEYDDDDT